MEHLQRLRIIDCKNSENSTEGALSLPKSSRLNVELHGIYTFFRPPFSGR